MKGTLLVCLFGLVAFACGEVYFKETFDKDWESRWVLSKFKEAEGTAGKFGWTAGKYFSDAEEDKGLQTSQDARFYQISAALPKEFSNKGKDLIIQYSVKHEQKIDCGGGYIKLHPAGIDQANYNGDTKYNIMFGPDICGSTKRVHVIFNYKDQNHLIKKTVPCESDEFTHVYTLVLKPDNTYQVKIDDKEVAAGSLKEDWDMLPAKEIKDPKASKPADWVDEAKIPDPTDKKPAGWDEIPEQIADPDAKKPDDWDAELDGEWEPPLIDNPDFKGEWKPKLIDNPAYKGEWVHPLIPNPDFHDDNNLYLYESNKFVGFELWQVKAGTIFDNILVTDSAAEAEKFAAKAKKTQDAEKAAAKKAEEAAKAEEEAKAKEAEKAQEATEEKDEL